MDELIRAIKAKRGLANLDDAFVREKVESVFRANSKVEQKFLSSRSFAQFSRSAEYEILLKAIRRDLRRVYGVFQEGEREKLLQEYVQSRSDEDLRKLLETHTSTRERLPYYNEIYGELARRIARPRKILDLGCGLNPLSYQFMAEHGWHPYVIAIDLSSADMAFLSRSFMALGIPGEAHAMDLTKEYARLATFEVDIVFLFKLLDSLEETERHVSYKIFENLNAKFAVVSFPTKSLGGRRSISAKGRSWFERLLRRLSYEWGTYSTENELFYVVKR